MRDSPSAHCLQGGGVYVQSGTVTISSSSIYGNTAGYVRAHVPVALLGYSHVSRYVLAVRRRCLCFVRLDVRHSHDWVFLDLREHRRICARAHVPVALLGYSHVLRYVLAERRRCLCTGRHSGLNRQLPSVFQPSWWRQCTCQPRLQNPIALFHMFRACACSPVAVSMFRPAQSR